MKSTSAPCPEPTAPGTAARRRTSRPQSAPGASAQRLDGRAEGEDRARRLFDAARSAHERAERMRRRAGALDDRMAPLRTALLRRASELELRDAVLEQAATGLRAISVAR